MNVKDVFSERLENLRIEQGITRQKVADDLQISRASLEYYEKGKRVPDIITLCAIAEYYNVSADYLLGRTTNKTTDTDLQAVCDYTGLSEKAVKNIQSQCNKGIVDVVSTFLEDTLFFYMCGEIYDAVISIIKYEKYRNEKKNIVFDEAKISNVIDEADRFGFSLIDNQENAQKLAIQAYSHCKPIIDNTISVLSDYNYYLLIDDELAAIDIYKNVKGRNTNAQHNQKQK